MNARMKELLAEAEGLPADERAEMAYALLDTLDGAEAASTEEVERAWAVEIQRRIEDVDSGRVKLVPMEEAIARARLAMLSAGRQP